MRKSVVVKIDDNEFIIKELRVRDIYSMIDSENNKSIMDRLDMLLSCCSDLDKDKIMDMTPSDLLTLYEGFKEVNAAFLEIAAAMGFSGDMIKDVVSESLQALSIPSSQADMAG